MLSFSILRSKKYLSYQIHPQSMYKYTLYLSISLSKIYLITITKVKFHDIRTKVSLTFIVRLHKFGDQCF